MPTGFSDSCLAINGIAAGNNMKQLSIAGSLNALGRAKDTFQVIGAHQAVIAGNSHHAAVIHRGDMSAGNANIG